MSRAAISLYANGERAVDFPRPVARVTSESPLWDWLDVARWLHKAQKVTMETVFEAKLVRDVNLAIMAGEYSQTHLGKKLLESGSWKQLAPDQVAATHTPRLPSLT